MKDFFKKCAKKYRAFDKNSRRDMANILMVLAAGVLVLLADGMGLVSSSLRGQLVPICAYVVMAISLNLTVGVLGELSLGHAGFMSIGAFSGVFFTMWSESFIPSLPVRMLLAFLLGGLLAGIMGAVIGVPVLRLQGDYLAIVTLAFGEIIKNIMMVLYVGYDESGIHFAVGSDENLSMSENGTIIINGAQGISGGRKVATFFMGVILVLVTVIVVQNLVRSRAGRAIMAIRDNRIAAEAMGINVTKYKLMAFIISAVLAGMAGVLYGHNYSAIMANKFNYNTSILVLVFVVLGGMGSVRGSIIAATVLYILPELLRGLEDYRMLIYAVVLIAMMIFNQSPKIAAWREVAAEKLAGLRGRLFKKAAEKEEE